MVDSTVRPPQVLPGSRDSGVPGVVRWRTAWKKANQPIPRVAGPTCDRLWADASTSVSAIRGRPSQLEHSQQSTVPRECGLHCLHSSIRAPICLQVTSPPHHSCKLVMQVIHSLHHASSTWHTGTMRIGRLLSKSEPGRQSSAHSKTNDSLTFPAGFPQE